MSNDLSISDVKVSIVNPLEQESRLKLDARGAGEFVPEHAGMHEIVLTVDDIRYSFINVLLEAIKKRSLS